MKCVSAYIGYYLLSLLLLNLVNVSKCSEESLEEEAENENETYDEESEEDDVVDEDDEDEDEGVKEEDPKSIKSPGLNEYESFLSSRDFRVSIIKLF